MNDMSQARSGAREENVIGKHLSSHSRCDRPAKKKKKKKSSEKNAA